jgi:hypothetical protein
LVQSLEGFRRKQTQMSPAERSLALKNLNHELYLADCWLEWPVLLPATGLTRSKDMLRLA